MRDTAAWFRALLFALVVVIATGVAAQQAPTAAEPQNANPAPKGKSSEQNPTPAAAPAHTPNASQITVKGCLNGGKQGYTLMEPGNGTSFRLEGENYKLKNMRGKLVQITGREQSPDPMSHNLPRLQVQGLEVISDHCVLPGKASGASTTVPQTNATQNNTNKSTAPDAATPKYESPGAPNQTPPSQGNNPTTWGRTSGAPSPGTGNPPPPKQ